MNCTGFVIFLLYPKHCIVIKLAFWPSKKVKSLDSHHLNLHPPRSCRSLDRVISELVVYYMDSNPGIRKHGVVLMLCSGVTHSFQNINYTTVFCVAADNTVDSVIRKRSLLRPPRRVARLITSFLLQIVAQQQWLPLHCWQKTRVFYPSIFLVVKDSLVQTLLGWYNPKLLCFLRDLYSYQT